VGLIDDVGAGRVGVDTSVFIYLIEESPVWLPVVRSLFVAADAGGIEIVTSSVTLLEVLVMPYRAKNDRLAERYEALLTRSRGVSLVELSRQQLWRAAEIRANYGARTPDALQLAAALDAGCSTFVTNDRHMPEIAGLRVLQLGMYAS
jgi:predicted nucleic acid-binding protein